MLRLAKLNDERNDFANLTAKLSAVVRVILVKHFQNLALSTPWIMHVVGGSAGVRAFYFLSFAIWSVTILFILG